MGTMATQIASLTIVYSTVYSGSDKKTPKLCATGLCARNSPVTGEFSAQMASNAENVSIWWRHHGWCVTCAITSQMTDHSNVCSLACSGWHQTDHQMCALQNLCEGNPLVHAGFPKQRTSNAERCFHVMTPWQFVKISDVYSETVTPVLGTVSKTHTQTHPRALKVSMLL